MAREAAHFGERMGISFKGAERLVDLREASILSMQRSVDK
jgi:hypothetical protein